MSDEENYRKSLAGRPYHALGPLFSEMKTAAAKAKAKLDAISNEDMPARMEAAKDLFAEGSGPCIVLSPFEIQYGKHVKIGEFTFVNFGATFLDSGLITLGDRVAVGPNVQFITDTHPVRPEDRFGPPIEGIPLPFSVFNLAYPITVENEVWIGAGAIILPGVTIGAGAMVAAGSVVTKDVAPRTVVGGNPAQVIGSVDDDRFAFEDPG